MVTSPRPLNLYPLIKYVLLLIFLVSGIVWYAVTHSAEALVKRQLGQAAQLFSKLPGESPASTAYKVLAFERLLADPVTCSIRDFPYNGSQSANTFNSLLFRSRGLADTLSVDISSMECVILDGGRASVRCAVRAFVNHGERSLDERRFCNIILIKQNGAWKISEIQDDALLKK